MLAAAECSLFFGVKLQEAYSMLNKFEVSVSREEVEGVDTLRYSFEKLLAQAVSDKTSNTGFICVHP